jgi:hypothetical protein
VKQKEQMMSEITEERLEDIEASFVQMHRRDRRRGRR